MGTMTLTIETPEDEKLYLYPESDISGSGSMETTGSSRYGVVNDDKDNIDYNNYVYVDVNYWRSAYFGMEDHIIGTGTINYVKMYQTIRSSLPPASENVYYRFRIFPTGNTAVHYSSDYLINLTNSWSKESYLWAENPHTGTAWTWSDINTMYTGIGAQSAQNSGLTTTTLRPNAVGSYSQMGVEPFTNSRWTVVDEETLDTDDYLYNTTQDSTAKQTFHISTGTFSGTITNVTIYGWAREMVYGYWKSNCAMIMRLSGNEITSTPANMSHMYNWKLYTLSSDTAPHTGAWTQADIDDLEIGIQLHTGKHVDDNETRCAQLYAVVTHYASEIPQIQIASCYTEVGYTPAAMVSYLNKPSKISINHSSNVKMLNFWSGNREVYTTTRSNKTTIMCGTEYGDGSMERINNVRAQTKNKGALTISDLDMPCYNGIYKVRSFGWKRVSKKPEVFEWILELEDTELL